MLLSDGGNEGSLTTLKTYEESKRVTFPCIGDGGESHEGLLGRGSYLEGFEDALNIEHWKATQTRKWAFRIKRKSS